MNRRERGRSTNIYNISRSISGLSRRHIPNNTDKGIFHALNDVMYLAYFGKRFKVLAARSFLLDACNVEILLGA